VAKNPKGNASALLAQIGGLARTPSGDELEAMAQRIRSACLTLRSLPGDGPRGYFNAWPVYRAEWWDAGAEISKRSDADIARRFLAIPRFKATAAQIDDCLPALRLLDGVTAAEREVLTMEAVASWYSLAGGWRRIGRACGMSHTHARRLHWACIVLAYSRQEAAKRSAAA
jgi:hypothetical protein